MGTLRSLRTAAGQPIIEERRREREKQKKILEFLSSLLNKSIQSNDLVSATQVIEKLPDFIADRASFLAPYLCDACMVGSYETARLLLRYDANVNVVDHKSGKTPPIFGVLSGCPDLVNLLLKAGVEIYLRQPKHRTALFWDGKLKPNQRVLLLTIAGAKK